MRSTTLRDFIAGLVLSPPHEIQKLSLLRGTESVVDTTAGLEGGTVLSILRIQALAQGPSK